VVAVVSMLRCIPALLIAIICGSLMIFAIGLIFFTMLGILPYPLGSIWKASLLIAVVSFFAYGIFSYYASKVCPI